jgi:hypothetical protein
MALYLYMTAYPVTVFSFISSDALIYYIIFSKQSDFPKSMKNHTKVSMTFVFV